MARTWQVPGKPMASIWQPGKNQMASTWQGSGRYKSVRFECKNRKIASVTKASMSIYKNLRM